ncbi:MAG: diadenylate cyclase CdaA [Eubacteriales bacterium]|nr:diadenylate cyclase CdaA [Eubacteriales bacterium]
MSYDVLVKTISSGMSQFRVADAIDILVIAFLIYRLLLLTRETRAYQVLKGVGVLFVVAILSDVFQITTLSWLLNSIITAGILVIVILFQPEIRRMLEHVGRGKLLSGDLFSKLEPEADQIVKELHTAVMRLAKRRVGALIVIERETRLGEIISTGTQIDGIVSAPLIENIFEPNTPLHDGAVILRDGMIIAAACYLPLSEDMTISRDLGTRHRAALGVSTVSDSVTIVVSEETGVISFARDAKLIRYVDDKALRDLLESLFMTKEANGSSLMNVFKRRTDEDGE